VRIPGERRHRHGKGQCDRCGFVYKLSQLHYEWTGFRVCTTCWDPRHPQDFPAEITAENTALVDSRPRNNTEASQGIVQGQYQIFGRTWWTPAIELSTGEVVKA
jgi:hypothetical protein